MIIGAIPKVLQGGNGIAPFLISLFLLAIGAGLFKPNVAPTILDQYRHQKPYIRTLPSGERVVVDPEVTVQRVMLVFYGFINIGAFFAIATSYSEKYVGFWLAFLAPGIIYFALPALLWYLYPRLTVYPPDGSALTKVWRILSISMKQTKGQFWKHEAFWQAARPSVLAGKGITSFGGKAISWTDKDVDDVRRTMVACAIFLYFPIYNLNDGGIGSVATSMGSTLTTNGAPNDLLVSFIYPTTLYPSLFPQTPSYTRRKKALTSSRTTSTPSQSSSPFPSSPTSYTPSSDTSTSPSAASPASPSASSSPPSPA